MDMAKGQIYEVRRLAGVHRARDYYEIREIDRHAV
jgi:hypothetical protein